MGSCSCKQYENKEEKYGNYITAEINIEEDYINEEIRIINSNEEIIIEGYFFNEPEYEKEE